MAKFFEVLLLFTLLSVAFYGETSGAGDKKEVGDTSANDQGGDDENKEKYFTTPEEWFKDYEERFDPVAKAIPERSSHPGVQRNIQVANAYANEIKRMNGNRKNYMARGNIVAISFMQGQEVRLNRLGLFTNPLTWSTIRCGAGYLSSDCGKMGNADSKAQSPQSGEAKTE